MATQTPNFNFDLRESADIFNPLSTNANFESLDTILKNLQETGGITTYTTTAAANLLKLSGTPKVNDTVFKFVAAGDANTWTAATGGVINNIVALDGKQVTIKGGNMYVAWVNSANAMVVVAWPAVVDAQTFDGKGPTEWATKVQLNAVNETAGNAVTTAQAAAAVANHALDVAQAATTIKETLLWTNSDPTEGLDRTASIALDTPIPSDAKYIKFVYCNNTSAPSTRLCVFAPIIAGKESSALMGCVQGGYQGTSDPYFRFISIHTDRKTFEVGRAVSFSGGQTSVALPIQIIAVSY